MSNPSNIFLTNESLNANVGNSINLGNYGLISTSSVDSPDGPTTPATNIFNLNQLSSNLLLNGIFSTGDFTSWTTNAGNIDVVISDYPGLMYAAQLDNLGAIWQQISGLAGKHPFLTFYYKGSPAIVTLETDTAGNALVGSQNKVLPRSDIWIKASMGFYSGDATAVKAQCTFFSTNDGLQIANVSLCAVDDFAGMTIGDAYLDNRNMISMSAQKLFLGNGSELPDTRTEGADFRTDMFVKGDLTVNGSIFSSIIYGPPGVLPWSTNLIFSSSSSTVVQWTSGIVQTIDTTSYGISSGSTPTLSSLLYIYLDLDVSSSILQTTTDYTLSIGNRKILVASAINGSTGFASFKVFSGQQNVVNGADQIASASIVNGNISVNTIQADRLNVTTLSAITASMGSLSIDNLLTMKETTSAITIGVTGTLPTSATVGTGIWLDRSGIYSLSSNVQNATLTSAGLSASGVLINSSGLILSANSSTTSFVVWKNGATPVASIYGQDDGLTHTISLLTDAASGTNKKISFQALGAGSSDGSITFSVSQGGSALIDFFGIMGSNKTFYAGPGGGGIVQTDFIQLGEVSSPGTPLTDNAYMYVEDNGSGKTRLMVKFATGAAQQISIQS